MRRRHSDAKSVWYCEVVCLLTFWRLRERLPPPSPHHPTTTPDSRFCTRFYPSTAKAIHRHTVCSMALTHSNIRHICLTIAAILVIAVLVAMGELHQSIHAATLFYHDTHGKAAALRRLHFQEKDPFTVENIDFSTPVPCGYFKCFFRVLSNPSVGYLVTRDDTVPFKQSLAYQWKAAQHLQSTYGVPHLLLEEPQTIPVTEAAVATLSQHLVLQEDPARMIRHRRYVNASALVVQKVQLAPQPSLQYGCREGKVAFGLSQLPAFLEHVGEDTAQQQQFGKTLRAQVALQRRLLQAEPGFAHDYHFLMDTQGMLWQLDLANSEANLVAEQALCETSLQRLLTAVTSYYNDGGSTPVGALETAELPASTTVEERPAVAKSARKEEKSAREKGGLRQGKPETS
jgi:hypothetical protein